MSLLETIDYEIKTALAPFPELDSSQFIEKVAGYIESREDLSFEKAIEQIILLALDEMGANDGRPNWTFVAARLYLASLYHQAAVNRRGDDSLVGLIEELVSQNIYNSSILDSYSREEIDEVQSYIVQDRDYGFTYIGLLTLANRYLAKSRQKQVFELPQERFAVIAMGLMVDEDPAIRLGLIKKAYDVLSKRYMTVATPTLSNAGKSVGQFSSCFIDIVGDDLQSIFDSNTDVANLSKSGGGIGVYLGKIRSRGSDIKGFPGVSSGVLPWMKQLNNTAVSVDQLGQRKGAIAVYLDVWHKDIFSYLDAKLNNGDERYRTHDLFTGVCIPDIFMETVDARGEWYIFDPHSLRKELGFNLEDRFDEELGKGSFRNAYAVAVEAAENGNLGKQGLLWDKVPAIEIMKRIMISQLETGTPFMFYRDEVNRMNANSHKGMIYCTNLCTEITQNQSETFVEEQRTEDGKIIITKHAGDFVVCNLSSINLGELYKQEGDNFFNALEELIDIEVRMLDNVIDLNRITVLQAQLTNERYRGIGLGTFGWHHYLALKKIPWNSALAVEESEKVYNHIAYCTIKASAKLAQEKGSYPYFEGSDFHTGAYFTKRGYTSPEWKELQEMASQGMRNGYLMAVAPNASTSIIAGSSASIDPIFNKFYSEEKKDYKVPVTAPDLSPETTWYYTSAYNVKQSQSIKQNAARQRHVDQAISFNLYVPNTVKATELLDLHLQAWKSKLKTTYYVRSTSQEEIDDCDSCSS
jgi:ribonucleoside-diphosphate reductase alpha chain